jgi:hypothetical protein
MAGVPLATADALAVGALAALEVLVVGSALALGGALAEGRTLAVGLTLGRPLALGCEVATGGWLLATAGALEAAAEGLVLGCAASVALAWGAPEGCAELEPRAGGVSLDAVPHAQTRSTGAAK